MPGLDTVTLSKIQSLLADKQRDLLLFYLIAQTELPITDILRLRIKDVENLQPGDMLTLKGKNSSLGREQVISPEIARICREWLSSSGLRKNDFLFSGRTAGKPLDKSSVSNMVNGWLKALNIHDKTGTKALRQPSQPKRAPVYESTAFALGSKGTTSVSPVECFTYSETIYRHLLKAIVSGNISPGQSLTVSGLSQEMKVGHMPVREALIRLEADGFLTTQRGKGREVKLLSIRDLKEIMTIRQNLETLAAEIAVTKFTEERLAYLRDIFDRYARAWRDRDSDTLRKTNREYHFAIYASSEMPILLSVIDGLWNKIAPYFSFFYHDDEFYRLRGEKNIQIHRDMLAAVESRSPERIRYWVSRDMSENSEFLFSRLQAREQNNRGTFLANNPADPPSNDLT